MVNILDQWRVAYTNAQNTVDGHTRDILPVATFDQRIRNQLCAAALLNVGAVTIHEREGRVAGVEWRYGNTALAVPVMLGMPSKMLKVYRNWMSNEIVVHTSGGDLARAYQMRMQRKLIRVIPSDLSEAEANLFTAWALGMGYAYLPHSAPAPMCMASRGRDWWGNQL